MAENSSIDSCDPDKKLHYSSVAGEYNELLKYLKPQNAIHMNTICNILKPHLKKKPEVVVDLGGGTGMLTGSFHHHFFCQNFHIKLYRFMWVNLRPLCSSCGTWDSYGVWALPLVSCRLSAVSSDAWKCSLLAWRRSIECQYIEFEHQTRVFHLREMTFPLWSGLFVAFFSHTGVKLTCRLITRLIT